MCVVLPLCSLLSKLWAAHDNIWHVDVLGAGSVKNFFFIVKLTFVLNFHWSNYMASSCRRQIFVCLIFVGNLSPTKISPFMVVNFLIHRRVEIHAAFSSLVHQACLHCHGVLAVTASLTYV